MPEAPTDQTPDDDSEEPRYMHVFHLVFGHGSSQNPGGSFRQETGGWFLVLSPVIVPIMRARNWPGEPGGEWMIPFMVILGVFMVRSAKKLP